MKRRARNFRRSKAVVPLSIESLSDKLLDFDKAILKPEAEQALKKVAVVLSQFPESHVTVEGYTDSKGTQSANMQLSRERAQAVKDWLVKNGGVRTSNISTKAWRTISCRAEHKPMVPTIRWSRAEPPRVDHSGKPGDHFDALTRKLERRGTAARPGAWPRATGQITPDTLRTISNSPFTQGTGTLSLGGLLTFNDSSFAILARHVIEVST